MTDQLEKSRPADLMTPEEAWIEWQIFLQSLDWKRIDKWMWWFATAWWTFWIWISL